VKTDASSAKAPAAVESCLQREKTRPSAKAPAAIKSRLRQKKRAPPRKYPPPSNRVCGQKKRALRESTRRHRIAPAVEKTCPSAKAAAAIECAPAAEKSASLCESTCRH